MRNIFAIGFLFPGDEICGEFIKPDVLIFIFHKNIVFFLLLVFNIFLVNFNLSYYLLLFVFVTFLIHLIAQQSNWVHSAT